MVDIPLLPSNPEVNYAILIMSQFLFAISLYFTRWSTLDSGAMGLWILKDLLWSCNIYYSWLYIFASVFGIGSLICFLALAFQNRENPSYWMIEAIWVGGFIFWMSSEEIKTFENSPSLYWASIMIIFIASCGAMINLFF
jgi:hypothetical protein